jgi:hypothetical protein
MKKFASTVLFSLFAISASAEGLKPLALPGHMWAIASTPTSLAERGNVGLTFSAEQGADWALFGDSNQWKLNTHVGVSGAADNDGYDWNNKGVLSAGIRLSRKLGPDSVLDLGVQVVHERRWKSNYEGTGLQVYARVWTSWDLKGE